MCFDTDIVDCRCDGSVGYMKKLFLIFICVYLTLNMEFVSKGRAIKCFNCDSDSNPFCANLTDHNLVAQVSLAVVGKLNVTVSPPICYKTEMLYTHGHKD